MSNYKAPRHGRIPYLTLPGPQVQAPVTTGSSALPTVDIDSDVLQTDLQHFNGRSVTPFLRWAFQVNDSSGRPKPNHNFNPDMNNAIYWSETIDKFDNDARLIHELILALANRNLAHPAMFSIVKNRSMVEMLLYRHWKRHGGIILPPMAPALKVMREYEAEVLQAREVHGQRTGQMLMPGHRDWPTITFPKWEGD